MTHRFWSVLALFSALVTSVPFHLLFAGRVQHRHLWSRIWRRLLQVSIAGPLKTVRSACYGFDRYPFPNLVSLYCFLSFAALQVPVPCHHRRVAPGAGPAGPALDLCAAGGLHEQERQFKQHPARHAPSAVGWGALSPECVVCNRGRLRRPWVALDGHPPT